MNHFYKHFFIITGAPSSGKTTLLDALEDRAFRVMKEGGPFIIEDQITIGGNALPWKNQLAYSELLLNWDLRSYREALNQNQYPILFDQAIPDIIAFLKYHLLPVPPHLYKAAEKFRYNKKVLIIPFWEKTSEKDPSHSQSLKETQRLLDATLSVYEHLDYEPCILPQKNLDQQISFIKEMTNKSF